MKVSWNIWIPPDVVLVPRCVEHPRAEAHIREPRMLCDAGHRWLLFLYRGQKLHHDAIVMTANAVYLLVHRLAATTLTPE